MEIRKANVSITNGGPLQCQRLFFLILISRMHEKGLPIVMLVQVLSAVYGLSYLAAQRQHCCFLEKGPAPCTSLPHLQKLLLR